MTRLVQCDHAAKSCPDRCVHKFLHKRALCGVQASFSLQCRRGICGGELHHLRDGHGLSERAPWWETIPLCNEHHNGSKASTHGALRREFHHAHGSEREMLQRVNERLPEELRGGAS